MNTSPVRVLHVITRMVLGGAPENTLLTVQGLDRLDRYEVALASGGDLGPEGDLLTRAGETSRLHVLPQMGRAVNLVADAAALGALVRLIRRGGYDIVHTHSSKAGVLGRVAARIAGARVVVHTVHGLPFHDYQPRAVNRLWRMVERAAAPLTDHYVSVADVVTAGAVAARVAPPERFTTIRSGMELDWYIDSAGSGLQARCELGIPPQAPVVGKVARLFTLKGHDDVLDAWPDVVARHPEARLLVVGDGILREELEARAQATGVGDSIVFAGLVGRERMPSVLAAMDVLVHASLWEGLARVLPQALAAGVPCVAVDLDGTPEVVIDGQTGLLVEPSDPAALAGAVNRLLGDADLRKRMGVAGRDLVDPDWRAETMVEQITALYEKLLRAS